MTTEPPQDWHRPGENAVTFRLPERYKGLLEWAEALGLSDALEIIYLSIGSFADPRAIVSLRDWVANEDYLVVWEDWSDDPLANRLYSFFDTLNKSTVEIPHLDSKLPLKGEHPGPSKVWRDFSKDGAPILAPYIYLSPQFNAIETTEWVRRYRLLAWLLRQSAYRALQKGGGTDTKIKRVARYLTIESSNAKWAAIDRLLRRADNNIGKAPCTFERFTYHLLKAIELSKPRPNENKHLATILHAISDIAQGLWGEDDKQNTIKLQIDPDRYSAFAPIEPELWTHEELGDWIPLEQPAPDTGDVFSPNDEDNPPDAILVPVDPHQTPLEQTLTSQAVFLHNAEQSHFLPWSWDKLLPPEITQLEDWVDAELDSDASISRAGAAIAWLAMHTGRSLYHTNRITISDEHGEEWCISSDFTRLQRLSPRRHNAWQPKTDAAARAVKPSTDRLTFTLPDKVTAALSELNSGLPNPASTLWDLWQSVSPTEKIEVWFDRQAREHFPRVTSGKLEQVAGQRIFNQTGDDHLSRLLVAPPRSGLPAACGYASWDMNAIAAGLPPDIRPHTAADASTRFLGSLLAPREELLQKEIDKAGRQLTASLEGDLVSFHNRYAKYVVTALYAATGCRHLRSPFETIDHFSLEHSCVYINDKNDGGVHAGRLVPLPRSAVTLLTQYRGYLERLADAISPLNPALATNIAGLTFGGSALPLFFLLDEFLNWHQMSDADLPGLPLFEWPLPPNLFRHRYSQQMAALGVETDVIDGWMGHAERAVATYGDSSPRCWADDAKQYQATIDACFDGLGFRCLSDFPTLPPYSHPVTTDINEYSPPKLFGEAERKKERRFHRKRSTQRALIEIEEFLDGRDLESLTEDEFEALSKRILLRSNGLPYPDAANRYRVLERKVRRLGTQCTRKIRTRYAQFSSEKSLVTSEVIPALTLWRALSRWCSETRKSVNKSQMSRPEALCIGILLLCLEKRISYRRLVFDGLRGEHFRLVQHKKRFYFEYSEEWDPSDFSVPTQRHEISYKVASLLAFGKELKSSVDPTKKICPKRTQGLLTILLGNAALTQSTTLATLFERLLSTIQQANLATLPGMVAAALSERRPTTSLPWQDFLRITENSLRVPPGLAAETQDDYVDELRINQGIPLNSDQLELQDETKNYTKELLHLLQGYVPSKSRDCAKAIDKVSTRYTGKISVSILMLGHWLAHLIRRGKGRGKHHVPYAQSSIRRYFEEMRGSFAGFLYDTDLFSLESDQITDLYSDMLEARRKNVKGIGYFSRRLKVFHRWAESIGCEPVDWSELDTDDDIRSVRPGALSEKEYLAAQRLITVRFKRGSDEALFLGFVLFLMYRFGLRPDEAKQLRRKDWCTYQQYQWVLVRNNHLRKLKRRSSRRAIPLLFPLTAIEQSLINSVLARCESLSPKEENAPILCDLEGGRAIVSSYARVLSATLTDILRSVTGDPTVTLYHCRHHFHNVAASILLPIDSPAARALRKGFDLTSFRRRVLGDQHGLSRRTGMALARLMGHHRPDTGLRSYNHLLSDWADALTPVESDRTHRLAGVYRTEDFDIATPELITTSPNTLALPHPDLSKIFRTLRLVSFGKPFAIAGEINLLPPSLIQSLESTFADANAAMRFKIKRGSAWFKGDLYPNALLHYVSDTAWLRILECTENLEVSPMELQSDQFPPLIELPFMTGMNRHILMSHQRHVDLAALVLSLFNVPASAFKVLYADGDNDIASIMQGKGWPAIALEEGEAKGSGFQLDIMRVPTEGKKDTRSQRGGLVIERCSEGALRTSYELAVALLAVGVYVNYLNDEHGEPYVRR